MTATHPDSGRQEEWFWNDWCSPLGSKREWRRAEIVLLKFITGRSIREHIVD